MAFATYGSTQCASYARQKLHNIEYPPGFRLAVNYKQEPRMQPAFHQPLGQTVVSYSSAVAAHLDHFLQQWTSPYCVKYCSTIFILYLINYKFSCFLRGRHILKGRNICQLSSISPLRKSWIWIEQITGYQGTGATILAILPFRGEAEREN